MIIDGSKYACEPCMRGHRSSKCNHGDRVLIKVRKPGRPLSTCPHDENDCTCGSTRFAIPKAQNCPCPPKGQTFDEILANAQGASPLLSSSVGPIRTNGSFRDHVQSYGGQPYPPMMSQDRRRTFDGTDEPHPVVVKLPTSPGKPERIVLRNRNAPQFDVNVMNGLSATSPSSQTAPPTASVPGHNYTFHSTNQRYSAYDGQGGFSIFPRALNQTNGGEQLSEQPPMTMPSYTRDNAVPNMTSYSPGIYGAPLVGGLQPPFPNRLAYSHYTSANTPEQNQQASYFHTGSFDLNAALPRQVHTPGYDNVLSNAGFVHSNIGPVQNSIGNNASPLADDGHCGSYSEAPDAVQSNHCDSSSKGHNVGNSDDVIKVGATEHHCTCGPGCQCLLCVEHPYNQSTLDYVRDLTTTIDTVKRGERDPGATDTSSALTFPNIEASSASADTFNFDNSASSTDNMSSNVNSGVDNGEEQDYVDSSLEAPASNYYHLNYPPSLYEQSDNMNQNIQTESDDPSSNQMTFAGFNMNTGSSPYDLGSNIQADLNDENLGLGDEKVDFSESWESALQD